MFVDLLFDTAPTEIKARQKIQQANYVEYWTSSSIDMLM